MSRVTSRDKLIEAAAKLFYERGVHATGVDAVVHAAGLTKPTLYSHFRSKDELVAAVLDLNEPYRSTLLLRFFEELSAEQIAQRIGVPASTSAR